MSHVRFEVERAGCESCASLVREALAPVLTIEELEIDQDRDVARVTAQALDGSSAEAVDRLLAAVSENSGHAYRVGAGSWHEES
jgi:copper chaperone CopZ